MCRFETVYFLQQMVSSLHRWRHWYLQRTSTKITYESYFHLLDGKLTCSWLSGKCAPLAVPIKEPVASSNGTEETDSIVHQQRGKHWILFWFCCKIHILILSTLVILFFLKTKISIKNCMFRGSQVLFSHYWQFTSRGSLISYILFSNFILLILSYLTRLNANEYSQELFILKVLRQALIKSINFDADFSVERCDI
jgi:hypothetical protein